jgi:predicted dehydrogenase
MDISVAVVGAGYWGPNLIRNFANLPGCRLAAVCDLDPARLAAVRDRHPGVRTTTQLDDLLADTALDAVAVATPAGTHYEITRACLEHGKHVLVEKPFVLDAIHGQELIDLARERHLVLMVDHIFLYSPVVAGLAGLLRAGTLGDLRYVRAVRTSLGPRLCEDTNIVWDAQIHDLYILIHLVGAPPIRVVATGGGFVRTGIEDVVFTTLFFPGGVVANCHNSSYAPVKERRMILVGSRRMAVYDELSPTTKLVIYDRGFAPYDGVDTLGNRGIRLYDEGSWQPEIAWHEPLQAECTHFLECVRSGTPPLSDGTSALQLLKVLQAIDRSLSTQEAVTL